MALCARFCERFDELGQAEMWSASDAEVTAVIAMAEQVNRRVAALTARGVGEAQRRDLAKTVSATGPVPWLAGQLTATPQRARAMTRLASSRTTGPTRLPPRWPTDASMPSKRM